MKARNEIADIWDALLRGWQKGEDLPTELIQWRDCYEGTGKGSVQLDYYPDLFVGDLRGFRKEPRLVTLGLNPGVAYPGLQSRDGIWAKNIAKEGYSRCFARSPEEDPNNWKQYNKKRSKYWMNMVRFVKRWLDDPDANHQDVLNFELYPWHSEKLSAAIDPPHDLIKKYVFNPISEINVADVLAFGADWFRLINRWPGLSKLFEFSNERLSQSNTSNWKLAAYRLPSGQRLVLSSQKGYSGPPGSERAKRMREILAR